VKTYPLGSANPGVHNGSMFLRCTQRWKDGKPLSMGTTGSDLFELSNYDLANALEQWILLSSTLFGTRDRNGLAFPVDLFQS
jgi:hypothetical protein